MGEIKPGDLVMVVKPTPCCGDERNCGRVFIAGDYVSGRWECAYCGVPIASDPLVDFPLGEKSASMRLSRLKKIDPPPIGDTLPTREELHA